MKKIYILLITVLFLSTTYAQKAKVSATLNFTGTVGIHPIEMKLFVTENSATGEYYYFKKGNTNKISLAGKLNNSELLLTESAYNSKLKKWENTGFFKLKYVQKILSGTWYKNEADAANALPVKLNYRENLIVFNPMNYDYQFVRENVQHQFSKDNTATYFKLKSVNIEVKKSPRWQLTVNDDDALMNNDNIELEDVNFDGFLDIKVPIYFPMQTKGDSGYLYFIYNTTSKKFDQNAQLKDLEIVIFDAVNKQVEKLDADGSGNEGTAYYKWHAGKLLLIKEERVYENDSYQHISVYKIDNGKSIKVKSYKNKLGN